MAPPTALAVDSATFYLAADRCFEVAEDLRDAFAVNVPQLADCGSMAGTYDSGRQWATSCDERSAEIFGAVNGVVAALHNYGDVLIGLGHTHELADHGAHLDPGAPPVPPPTPPLSPPAELSVPTCVGGPGEGLIDDALGLVDQIGVPVPDGDTDKLASARDVWDRLATVYQNVNTLVILQGAADLFVNETSPEIEYIDEDLGEIRSAIEDILHACGQMSESCEEYRAELEDLRLQLRGILDSLILEIAITATITIAAALVSFGTSALAGGTKAAESITRYARIIRDAVLGWRGLRQLQRGVKRERELSRLRDAMRRLEELKRKDLPESRPPRSSLADKGPELRIDDQQFGTKVRKHMRDFGRDPADPEAQKWLRDYIEDIRSNPDEVRRGNYHPNTGGGTDYWFYRQGDDVIILKENGDFVTIFKNGIDSGWFEGAVPQ